MARKTNNANKKPTRCFGVITSYHNRPGAGYNVAGQGPFVVFGKTWDQLATQQKSYIKDGDTVIEFEEVARYKIKNVSPSLEPVGNVATISE
jgi:hypothetical protein